MSEQKWLEAAAKYQAKQPVPTPPALVPAVLKAGTQGNSVEEITTALANFLDSAEGRAASAMLIASRRHVVLAACNEGGGTGYVIFYDGRDGIKESIETMGMWVAYAQKDDVPKPKVTLLAVSKAAQEIVEASQGRATAEIVMRNLRHDLDRIAAEADSL